MRQYENIYGQDVKNDSPGKRLTYLINAAHKQSEQKTVVIIDEYDAPMLDVLHDDEKMDKVRKLMQEFYAPLKACDADLRFVYSLPVSPSSRNSVSSVSSII